MARPKPKRALDPENQIELWLEYDVWPEQRTIFLGTTGEHEREESRNEVTSAMAASCIKKVMLLEHQDPGRPICVIMNSCGGSVFDGMAIYDILSETKCPVYMKCYGWCMSMATIILQSADVRILSPHCHFMIHDGTDGYSGHTRDFERWAEQAKKDRLMTYQIFASRSEHNVKFWEKQCAFDKILTAQETIEIGLADRIISPSKNWGESSDNEEES